MAEDKLQAFSEQLSTGKNLSDPPLERWNPALSGEIDIVIKRDGSWLHESRPIKRPELVRLFASILRREEDGEYYLVTPVEKWRLQVECLPLVVVDFDVANRGKRLAQQLTVTLNTGRQYPVDQEHPLYLPELDEAPGVPAIKLPHGLAAVFSRAAWYRLAEICEDSEKGSGVWSGGQYWVLA